jgi:hypothetical protein
MPATEQDHTSLTYFQRLPKVELHLHLEGAIPLPSSWRLIEKYGGDPDVPTIDVLRSRFRYRSFAHFLETWVWKNQFLREYEDFSFVAAVPSAPGVAAVRVREVMSRGPGPRTGAPPPEGVDVGYPPGSRAWPTRKP